MNKDIFWRLVWKEYRQQQALWIAIALAGLVFQAATVVYCSFYGISEVPNKIFTVALSVPILYSLGCGATLFAGEHETATFPFLQSLPVSAGRVLWAKLTFAVMSALLLLPVLWLVAYAMTGWKLPAEDWHLLLWTGGIVAIVEVLIWATLGSLLLRRVLPAAIGGGIAAGLLGYGSFMVTIAINHTTRQPAAEYLSTLPLRIGFALLAMLVVIKIGRQWFSEFPAYWGSASAQRLRLQADVGRRGRPSSTLLVISRLVWHQWRQSRMAILWCGAGYLVLATFLSIDNSSRDSFFILFPALATICGASVFAADQRQDQYQFFTEHGVHPRAVWFSRHFVWVAALAGASILAVMTLDTSAVAANYQSRVVFGFFMYTALAYSTSQLLSILIRSHIVAVFTAILSTILLSMWAVVTERFGIPWMFSACPMTLVMLWASWLYAPKWIQQRHSWRSRAITAATVFLPLAGVVAGTAAYRVYEIPAVTVSYQPIAMKDNDSPEARETAAMYLKAEAQLRQELRSDSEGATTISARDEDWRQGIDTFLAATKRKTCHFYHWFDGEQGNEFDGKQLTRSILAEAKVRVEEDDVAGAWELYAALLQLASHFYEQHSEAVYRLRGMSIEQDLFAALPDWADHDSATGERIQNARLELQVWSNNNLVNWPQSVIEHHYNSQQAVALNDQAMRIFYDLGVAERAALKTLGTLMPWERWRMLRLLNVYTETELQGILEVRQRVPQIAPFSQSALPWDVVLPLQDGQRQLIRSTDTEAWLLTTPWLNMTSPKFAPTYVAWEQENQVRRNAVQLQLALIAWRKQRGQLPDRLDMLRPDMLKELPLDPYTKQPFVYFAMGVEEEVWDEFYSMGGGMMMGEDFRETATAGEDRANWEPPKPRLVRSEPFLWSPGATLRYAPDGPRGPLTPPVASDFRTQGGDSLTDVDLLYQGVRYMIPLSKQNDPEQEPSESADNSTASLDDE